MEFPTQVFPMNVFCFQGAGSCLEALGAQKALLVVVNDKLMDNHQLELARQLHSNSHLLYCTCRSVMAKIAVVHSQSGKFLRALDSYLLTLTFYT